MQKIICGETGLFFRKGLNIHRSDVRLKKVTAVAIHFNCGELHGDPSESVVS